MLAADRPPRLVLIANTRLAHLHAHTKCTHTHTQGFDCDSGNKYHLCPSKGKWEDLDLHADVTCSVATINKAGLTTVLEEATFSKDIAVKLLKSPGLRLRSDGRDGVDIDALDDDNLQTKMAGLVSGGG